MYLQMYELAYVCMCIFEQLCEGQQWIWCLNSGDNSSSSTTGFLHLVMRPLQVCLCWIAYICICTRFEPLFMLQILTFNTILLSSIYVCCSNWVRFNFCFFFSSQSFLGIYTLQLYVFIICSFLTICYLSTFLAIVKLFFFSL